MRSSNQLLRENQDMPGEAARSHSILRFSLVELLIVIAIIAILAAMLMPALAQAKMRAQAVLCAANLSEHGSAVTLYLTDNQRRFPSRLIPVNGNPGNTSNWAIWEGSDLYNLGTQFYATDRPVNKYLGVKSNGVEVEMALCPSDVGRSWYELVGTSYAANTSFGPGWGGDNTQYLTLSQAGYTSSLSQIEKPSEMLTFVEASASWVANGRTDEYGAPNHSPRALKYNYLFVDGHVGALLPGMVGQMRTEDFSYIDEESGAY
jgi:prepilin-type N-terminal cleavage/methylation domain-containing protein/prepilin-type processing-associated H-X9-DG protein